MVQAIVKTIDHLLIRVSNPDLLYSIFHQQLLLSQAWPVMATPFFVSGGLHLGNTNLEIIRVGRQPKPVSLYGIAFDFHPFEESLPELERRGIPHTPPLPFVQVDEQGWQMIAWTSVFLGGMLDSHPLQQIFFKANQNPDIEKWEMKGRPGSSNRPFGIPYIYNTVYRKAATFGINYNPAWASNYIRKEPTRAGLGLRGVYEVTIGTRNFHQAREVWNNLLDPLPEVSEGVWRLPDDLHIRLIPHREEKILGMIWQVASLNRAAQFLHRRNMLGPEVNEMVTIDPAKIFGLQIRLLQ
jgi:hypothetical protein